MGLAWVYKVSGAGTADKKPYGGAIVLDDMLKAHDSNSAAMTSSLARLYSQTFVNRRNDPETTPIINISQRTGQIDLTAMLLNGFEDRPLDNYQASWKKNLVKIPAMENGCALWPEKHDEKYWLDLKENDPYTYWSQGQQEPISDASSIFPVDKIVELDEDPDMLATFITCDTAETAEKVNDASVFSLWGIYNIELKAQKTDIYAVHSIHVHEIRVEPDELIEEFELFYNSCLRYPVKPYQVHIEKKSTGGLLLSHFKKRQGLLVVDITRKPGESKTNRFHRAAPYISRGLLSINKNAEHKEKFKKHLKMITFDASQRFDDIADTMADAIRLALDDKVIYLTDVNESAAKNAEILKRSNEIMRSKLRDARGY